MAFGHPLLKAREFTAPARKVESGYNCECTVIPREANVHPETVLDHREELSPSHAVIVSDVHSSSVDRALPSVTKIVDALRPIVPRGEWPISRSLDAGS
jgi:hypothetical protein